MTDEMDVYLRGVLPLLDEEKISQLLSKGSHVVDKVFDIAQSDERLKEIVQSIYDAGTNQSLIDKLDGNKALAKGGYENFSDFYFNCEATKEKLVELADEAIVTNGDPIPYWKKVIANLYWDIPTENVFVIFSGFVWSVLNETSLPANTDTLEGAYNYLRFQIEKNQIAVTDTEAEKKIEDRLPNVMHFNMVGGCKTIQSLSDAIKRFEKKKASSRGVVGISGVMLTGSYLSFTGTFLSYSP